MVYEVPAIRVGTTKSTYTFTSVNCVSVFFPGHSHLLFDVETCFGAECLTLKVLHVLVFNVGIITIVRIYT